jgi:beta-fructofuranosidase
MRQRNGEIETELPCVAVAADDELISWVRVPENPVIAQPPPSISATAFRDHSLWKHGKVWRQAIGAGTQDRGGAILLYESSDLKGWSYVGVLCAARDHGLRGAIWECPDIFWIGDKAVVIVSVVEEGRPQHAMWMTGSMSGNQFVPQQVGHCDLGDRYYAPQSCTVSDGRRIAFGWLRESPHELRDEDRTRVGVMSLPRELTVTDGGALESRPASELTSARSDLLGRRVITDAGVVPVALDSRRAEAAELVLTPGAGTRALRVTLLGQGCDDVIIDLESGASEVRERQVILASPDSRTPEVPVPEMLQTRPLRIFYDQAVLEVFGDRCSPAAVICDRHGRYGAVRIEVTTQGGAEPTLVELWRCGPMASNGYDLQTAGRAGVVSISPTSMQNESGLDG